MKTKRNKISKIIAILCLFLILFTTIVSLFYQPKNLLYTAPNNNPDYFYTANNNAKLDNCYIENGRIYKTSNDSNVEFETINNKINTIKIEFGQNTVPGNQYDIIWNYDDTLSIEPSINQTTIENDNYLLYKTNNRNLKSIKIKINENQPFINVSCYQSEPDTITTTSYINPIYVIIAIVFAVLLTALTIILNKKYNWTQKIKKWFHSHKKIMLIYLLTFISVLAIASIIEILINLIIVDAHNAYEKFNFARWIFWGGLLTSILLIILVIKNKVRRPEIIFSILALCIGLTMIFSAPFGHTSWDVDNHFKWIKSTSNISSSATESENDFINAEKLSCHDFNIGYEGNNSITDELNNKDLITTYNIRRGLQISHIPGSVLYSITKFLNIPFTIRINLVRILYLLLYTILCAFAIKTIPNKKILLMVIALFPTNIFLASSLAYDWWVTSLILLGFAIFVKEQNSPDTNISTRNCILMQGSFMLACLPKQIYFPIMFLPFLLNKNAFQKDKSAKKRYFKILIFITSLLIVSLGLRMVLQLHAGGDHRGGTDVNAISQILFILNNPLEYLNILINFLTEYLSIRSTYAYISVFGYLGESIIFSGLITILIFVVGCLDQNSKIEHCLCSVKFKIISAAIFLMTIILIATSLYIDFTPVGNQTILGCQNRYITPLLFPLFYGLLTFNTKNIVKQKHLVALTTIVVSFVSYYDIYTIMLSKMM